MEPSKYSNNSIFITTYFMIALAKLTIIFVPDHIDKPFNYSLCLSPHKIGYTTITWNDSEKQKSLCNFSSLRLNVVASH